MGVFDLAPEQLKEYRGTNPKPNDFDTFWNDSLAELHQIDPDVKLEKSSFQAPYAACFHLYFTGRKGARIHAKLLLPRGMAAGQGSPAPAVIKFHGYTGNAGDWYDLLPYAAAGYVVTAMDCRGQGGLSEDVGGVKGGTLYGFIVKGLDSGPEELYYRNVFLDAARLAGIIMDRDDVDENRVGAFGASQGGGLTLACAALEPRIRMLAPVFPFLCDYQRVWEMDLAEKAYVGLRDYFRRFDPTHEKKQEIFTTLGYVDVQHLAERIKGEVLFTTGLMDTVCPPSTQYAAFNKIQAKKRHVLYPDFGHEDLPGHEDRQFGFFSSLSAN